MSRSFPNDSLDNRRKEIYTKDERVKYRVREKNFRKFKIT